MAGRRVAVDGLQVHASEPVRDPGEGGQVVAVRRPADPVARRLVVLFLSIAAIMQTYGSWGPLWLTGFLLLVVVPFAQIFSAYAALALAVTFPQPSARGIRRFLRRLNPWLLVTTLAVEAATIVLTIVGCPQCGQRYVWPVPSEAVLNAIYFKINASLVLQSMQIGDDITYLSEGEIELTKRLVYSENAVQRMWDYWSIRCGDKPR